MRSSVRIAMALCLAAWAMGVEAEPTAEGDDSFASFVEPPVANPTLEFAPSPLPVDWVRPTLDPLVGLLPLISRPLDTPRNRLGLLRGPDSSGLPGLADRVIFRPGLTLDLDPRRRTRIRTFRFRSTSWTLSAQKR